MPTSNDVFLSLTHNPPNYQPIARLQNEFKNKEEFIAEGVIPILEQILFPHISEGAHILDLGCGCGYLGSQLQVKGYKMTGIDASEALLSYARKNAPENNFILNDIRKFKLPPTFDAVVSIDVLLFILNNDDLTSVFRNVYAALQNNGLFIFSIPLVELMHKTVEEGYMNHVYVNDECALIELFDYDLEEKIWKIEVTGFELIDKVWKRSDTTWLRKDHLLSDVQSALENVGFRDISRLGDESQSDCFICWK